MLPRDDSQSSKTLAASIQHPVGIPQSRGGTQLILSSISTQQGDASIPGQEKSIEELVIEISDLRNKLIAANAKAEHLEGALDLAKKRLGDTDSLVNKLRGDLAAKDSNLGIQDVDLAAMIDRIRQATADVANARKEMGGMD